MGTRDNYSFSSRQVILLLSTRVRESWRWACGYSILTSRGPVFGAALQRLFDLAGSGSRTSRVSNLLRTFSEGWIPWLTSDQYMQDFIDYPKNKFNNQFSITDLNLPKYSERGIPMRILVDRSHQLGSIQAPETTVI